MALINEDISINSIIGRGSTIKGDMKISGFMRIDGDLDGNLETTGNVIVGEYARINGNITAKSATISGVVKGNIIAPESVHLMSSSSVIGDIQTHRLQADNNVVLHGHCISLKDETAYDDAVNSWQDAQAIASRSILQNIHISLDNTVFNSDLHSGISISDTTLDGSGF